MILVLRCASYFFIDQKVCTCIYCVGIFRYLQAQETSHLLLKFSWYGCAYYPPSSMYVRADPSSRTWKKNLRFWDNMQSDASEYFILWIEWRGSQWDPGSDRNARRSAWVRACMCESVCAFLSCPWCIKLIHHNIKSTRDVRNELLFSIWRLQISS